MIHYFDLLSQRLGNARFQSNNHTQNEYTERTPPVQGMAPFFFKENDA